MANTKISAFTAETDVANITGFAAFKTVGGSSTNVRISGSEIESTLNLSNFAVGTLPVGRGGTGATTFTANSVLIGNGTSAISDSGTLTDGQLLIGHTGSALAKATLTQGTDLSITNGNGSISIGHAAVSNTPASSNTTLSAGGTFTAINSVTVSAQGHLTAQNTETYTLPSDTNTTYAISASDGDTTDEEKIVLTAGGSGSGTSTVVLEASTGLTIARSTDKITFTNSSPNQATPAAGSSGQLQYNDGSNGFAASANLVYTTDTLTVKDNIVIKGDGSSDASKLKFNCYNNNHHVEIIGPDHAGSPNSYSIKLPNALPNVANQILESNASGTLSWIATPTDTDTSIYAANGSLTGARAVTMGSYNLSFVSSTAGQEVKFGQNVRIDGQSYNVLETISSVTSWTPNWDSGNVQTMELSGATTINNPSNIEVGATYIIILKQDAEGTHTVSWGSQYKFPAGTAPTITTTANKADVITLVAYSSTVLMCTSVQDFATS